MVNLISYDEGGHKVARPINSREEYLALRNSVGNATNFYAARKGDKAAKLKLLQFNYADQLPDGVLKGCHTATSTFCLDIDCGNEQECREIAQRLLSMKEQLGILEISLSPNWGIHVVLLRQQGKTILENQVRISMLAKVEMDCNAHDGARIMFTGPADAETLLWLDDRIFTETMTVEEGQEEFERLKEREANGEEELPTGAKSNNKHYRPWEATSELVPVSAETVVETTAQQEPLELPTVFGQPVMDIINTMYPQGAAKGQRHNTMLRLANDLIILLDGDARLLKFTLLSIPWVQQVVKERGEKEVDGIIDSAQKRLKKRETENFYYPSPSRDMQKTLESLTNRRYRSLVEDARSQQGNVAQNDNINNVLERIGKELKKLFRYYPLLSLVCHGLKPKHYPAALFVSCAFAMTLMTRCWYRFWPAPGRKCRLNSILELIGRFGSGKHMAVDLYNLMMEPIAKADAPQIDALNKSNEERETKGANKDRSARPKGIYRRLPTETSAAAIREAEHNAVEVIDGMDWPLHVSIFDSELENTIRQQGKSYMDCMLTLWLKAFHNEPQGSFLKTSSAIVGEYDVHFNCAYTGTQYSLDKQVNKDNYATGLHTRITAVPMGDTNFEMMEAREYTPEDAKREQMIRDWAYKLDKTKGEIPCKDISDELHKWTERRMEEAKEENSLVIEDLIKRPCWHGINYALPLIVSRHWDQMVVDKDGRWKCGVGFTTDKIDRKLAVLITDTQYTFQQHFFGPIAEEFYYERDLVNASRHHHQPRSLLNFHRLPETFTSQDVMKEYGYTSMGSVTSCLKRLKDDGMIQKVRNGEDKGKYRKLK